MNLPPVPAPTEEEFELFARVAEAQGWSLRALDVRAAQRRAGADFVPSRLRDDLGRAWIATTGAPRTHWGERRYLPNFHDRAWRGWLEDALRRHEPSIHWFHDDDGSGEGTYMLVESLGLTTFPDGPVAGDEFESAAVLLATALDYLATPEPSAEVEVEVEEERARTRVARGMPMPAEALLKKRRERFIEKLDALGETIAGDPAVYTLYPKEYAQVTVAYDETVEWLCQGNTLADSLNLATPEAYREIVGTTQRAKCIVADREAMIAMLREFVGLMQTRAGMHIFSRIEQLIELAKRARKLLAAVDSRAGDGGQG